MNGRTFPSLEQLASSAETSHYLLRDVVERRIDPYFEFRLAKSTNGVHRTIASPIKDLARAQRWMLDNLFADRWMGIWSFAYRRGVSAKDCAKVHVNARWLVKLDLKDFFHSVDENQVQEVFRNRGCDKLLAAQLARVCTRLPDGARDAQSGSLDSAAGERNKDMPTPTRLGHLPQGAPTSGMLANMAALDMDRAVSRLASRYKLRYSRYSDDLIFSGLGEFSRTKVWDFVRRARSEIASNQFTINEEKIRISPPGSRLMVLGLLVDTDRARLRTEYKKRLEWHVYGSYRFGVCQYAASRGFLNLDEYLLHVDGLFARALDVEPEWTRPLHTEWQRIKRQNINAG